MELRAAMEEYLWSLGAQGRSQGTLRFQRAILESFAKQVGEGQLEGIAERQALEWLSGLSGRRTGLGKPLEGSYIEQHRASAARFFRWAQDRGAIPRSPFHAIRRYPVTTRPIEVFTPEEVLRLLATQDSSFNGERNRLVMRLLYDTGIRVSEVCRLRGSDLGDVLRVRGKGRKERDVPVSRDVRAELLAWLNRFDRPASEAMFPLREGGEMQPIYVNAWMRHAAHRAVLLNKRVSPHTFRHSFATEYLRAGGDPLRLAMILGHSTLGMTMRYVHLAKSDITNRFDDLSPSRLLRPALDDAERERLLR